MIEIYRCIFIEFAIGFVIIVLCGPLLQMICSHLLIHAKP
jgi:hypothetical protein